MSDELAKQVFDNYQDFQKIALPLIILLSINLLALIGKFVSEIIIKDRDSRIFKINIISSRKIDVQEKLFQKLEALSIFTKDEGDGFFTDIKKVEIFMNQNKLYLEKLLYNQANKILDYYKSVYFDYRKKNYEEEINMFDEYTRIFYK